ncbi:MAG TPA: hypothetical protein VFB31_15605 [Pseudolabrys sp.]|nr:hypothetical protein [Pseudolabrys sp.]
MPRFPALSAACAAALLLAGPAAAQQKPAIKRVTLSALTAQGFEIKAALREAVVLQKGAEVYWCNLRLADSSPLSYQSDCFAVR